MQKGRSNAKERMALMIMCLATLILLTILPYLYWYELRLRREEARDELREENEFYDWVGKIYLDEPIPYALN